MPSLTAQGLPLHTRSLTVALSRKSDTLWHARGDIIDLRKTGFVPTHYAIQPSGIIHNMSIDIDFDPESLEMKSIDVDQPFVAIEASAATGGECCRDPAPLLPELAGDRLDAGFAKRLAAHFGGPRGCSHLLTLFQLMASTIPHGVRLEAERVQEEGTRNDLNDRFFRRSVFIDGFEKNSATVDVAIQLADTLSRPAPPGGRMTDRLRLSHEWKTLAEIDRKRFLIQSIETQERSREAETLGRSPWVSHHDAVAPLKDTPLIPGLAGRLFKLFGNASTEPALLDHLLQLAPGFLQIVAAMMDDYFEERETTPDGKEVPKPAVSGIGGATNSCYMWREDAAVQRPRP
ncbi:MAG: DUF2889 domain-containing protein [Myxococcota bacterium]